MDACKEFKLIVAGGRDFTDSDAMNRYIGSIVMHATIAGRQVSIVSGMAHGADALGAAFARDQDIALYEFPADWNQYGKGAGFIRNREMAQFADGLLAFWDGKSRGTKHMIETMQDMGKLTHIVYYKTHPVRNDAGNIIDTRVETIAGPKGERNV